MWGQARQGLPDVGRGCETEVETKVSNGGSRGGFGLRIRGALDVAEKETPIPYASVNDDSVNLIDTLPEFSYNGTMSMYDRPGHITGAVNIPVHSFLDESGRFKPLDQLAAMHDLDRKERAITYCGGGIAASGSAFVMTRLGFTDVAVYTASLQEWAADPANPMEDDAP